MKAFTHTHVPHPHADAISAVAFAKGVIRSETDFAVYSAPRTVEEAALRGDLYRASNGSADMGTLGYNGVGGGMRGADVAFYQHRARYHTPDDSIRAMGKEGARRALWSVMEVMKGAGFALLNAEDGAFEEPDSVTNNQEIPTFFEGKSLAIFVYGVEAPNAYPEYSGHILSPCLSSR